MSATQKLPAFALKDAAAVEHKFSTGRHTLLCFVKEDCPTCHLTIPLIEAAYRAFGAKLDVVAIGQDLEGNARLIEQYRLTTPLLDDSALKVSFAYDLDFVPTIILADPEGVELRRFVGFDKGDWQSLIAEMGLITATAVPKVDWTAIRVNVRDAVRNRWNRKSPSGLRPRLAAINSPHAKLKSAPKIRSSSCSSVASPTGFQ